MPDKTQEVFVRKKYVSTYNVSIFAQVVTPLQYLGARPPCSKKVASLDGAARYLTRQERYLCVIIISLRARITYYFSAYVHTQRSLGNQSFPPGRKTKIEKSSHFCLFKPLLNEMYSLSPLSTSCAQA